LVEYAIERPPVPRVLRRIEVKRGSPPGHRVLRDDDPEGTREVGRSRARGDDVVIAGEGPEIPPRAVGHRALLPQARPHRVRVSDELVVERVEVRRAHATSLVGTINVPHSGQPVMVTSPTTSIDEVRASSSSRVTRSISEASGAPAQR